MRDPDQIPKYHSEKLKQFPSVDVGDASCDFSSFLVSVKRQTENLWLHKYAGRYDAFKVDNNTQNGANVFDDQQTRSQLFAISNSQVDKLIIYRFYLSAYQHVTKTNLSEDDTETLAALARIIPDNPLGNQLTTELFRCDVRTFHNSFITLFTQLILEKGMRPTDETLSNEEIFYRDIYCQPNTAFQKMLEDELGHDFSAIAQALDKNGIVTLPQLFSGDSLKQMQQDFNRWCDGKTPDVHAHIQLGGSVEEDYFTDSAAMCRAVAHPLIWTLAAHAWGRDPILSAMRAYRINPMPPKRYRAFQPHNDGHGKEFKVMILLTDVKPGQQGMRYWQGTHHVQWQIHSSRDTLYTDSEAAQLGEPFECVGPAGTIFIFNINGIHSGVRNESTTRDTLVFSITAGKRLYPIPAFNENVISQLTDYEKALFRSGQENNTHEVEGELREQQTQAVVKAYLTTYSDCVKRCALHFRPMVESHRNAKIYVTSPFPLAEKPKQLTLNYSADINTQTLLPETVLLQAINEDPKRGMALPIRLYSGSRDKSRDLALCFIRDIWLSDQRNAQLIDKIKNSNALNTPINSDVLSTYQHCTQPLLLFLNYSKDIPYRNRVTLQNFEDFVKDLEWCLKTADSYVLVRTGLAFLLAIVDYFSESLALDVYGKNNLTAIFAMIALAYIGHIKLDLIQQNKKESEQGNEFKKYVSHPPLSLLFTTPSQKQEGGNLTVVSLTNNPLTS